MPRILLILPYFGKLSSYFHLFINSCYNNEAYVDFIIFTDCNIEECKNVKVVKMTWREFVNKVQSRFDFPISLINPYKLCDFRPAYGYIFSEYLKNYEYWGHCDCDLIWGDFKLFMPLLDKGFSRIGIWGHLSVYHNDDYTNRLFMTLEAPDVLNYQIVFSSSINYSFDEFNGINKIFKYNNITSCEERLFDDIIFYTKTFFTRREIQGGGKPKYNTPIFFRYRNGHLYRYSYIKCSWIEEESLYVHLQKRKMAVDLSDNDSNYMIVPNKFIEDKEYGDNQLLVLCKANFFDFGYYKI